MTASSSGDFSAAHFHEINLRVSLIWWEQHCLHACKQYHSGNVTSK